MIGKNETQGQHAPVDFVNERALQIATANQQGPSKGLKKYFQDQLH
jgi:hypothetical protein